MAQRTVRDYYKILQLGPSGAGKTYSFINMPREITGYINGEEKPLPFDRPFKYHARPKTFAGYMKALNDYAKNPEVESIIFEGFNMVLDTLLEEMRTNFRGFDIWSNYNAHVAKLVKLIKSIEKEMFVTGHYEILNIEGDPEKRLKVHGKEHEGRVESHFTIVLFADKKFVNNKPEFFFRTVGEGISAKCPPAIFGGLPMLANDSNFILEKVVEFAKKSQTTIETNEEIFT